MNCWRFSRYNAPIHWLDHGHMTSNNEAVNRPMPCIAGKTSFPGSLSYPPLGSVCRRPYFVDKRDLGNEVDSGQHLWRQTRNTSLLQMLTAVTRDQSV